MSFFFEHHLQSQRFVTIKFDKESFIGVENGLILSMVCHDAQKLKH